MKKRTALAASIALAISVGGMVPASATKLGAPTVNSSTCARVGGVLEVKADGGSITVSRDATSIVITGAGGTCPDSDDYLLAGLTAVVLKADDNSTPYGGEGNVSFDLAADGSTLNTFSGITFSAQAEGILYFVGNEITSPIKAVTGVLTEETFTFGTLTGAYYAGQKVVFNGGVAGDSLDASGVATTKVDADGGSGNDTLKGGAANDTLTGGAGDDTLRGGAGDDSLTANAGLDKLYGEDGTDTLVTSGDGTVPECHRHGRGYVCTDVASPAGADEAWGGAGDDYITADVSDTVAPGDGFDAVTGPISTLLYADSTAAVTITAGSGVVKSTAGDDLITGNVGAYVGSDFADTLTGTAGADFLFGGKGADKIAGGDGADTLGGGGGADTITGGTGADEIYGDTGADKLNGGLDNDKVYGGVGDDIMYGSDGDDFVYGNKGSDQAWGGKGTLDLCAAEVTDHCEFTK